MKIKKLLTLSQFINYLESFTLDELIDNFGLSRFEHESIVKFECYKLIIKYNEFLQQPLKKEMFVNRIRRLMESDDPVACELSYKEWQEAEEKVIFKGWKQSNTFKYDILLDGVTRLDFSNADFIQLTIHGKQNTILIRTLNGLAEKTNGELELNNIEL